MDWINLSKAETHLHLEGAIGPEIVLILHRNHGLKWSKKDIAYIRKELSFNTFAGFMEAFKQVWLSIKKESDFEIITQDFFRKLLQQNIVHCEFFFTPSVCFRLGLDADLTLEIILDTAEKSGREMGINWALVLDSARQLPVSLFDKTIMLALKYRDRGVVGIGIGGDELSSSLRPFQQGLNKAKTKGLRIHLHTGETGNEVQMLDDLMIARPERVGHGLPAASSVSLQEHIGRNKIVVDFSITSNMRTGLVDSLKDHPVRKYATLGLPFTISTDDPALFQTTLSHEYEILDELIEDRKLWASIMEWHLENPLLSEKAHMSLQQSRRLLDV